MGPPGATGVPPRPRHNRVIWVLNSACPSRCVYCDIESQRATRALTREDVERTSRQILDAGFREVVFVGGEPLLSPDLPAALRVLAGRCEVAVFTGGIPGGAARAFDVVRGGVDRLVFSIDSGRDGRNDLIRGRKGITGELLAFVELVRRDLPNVDVSVNTVVSRHNVGSLADVWERMKPYGLSSWALTLVGDNWNAQPAEHMLDREQIEQLYLSEIPALARATAARRVELVVLPIPFPFLAARIPPSHWGSPAPSMRASLEREFELYARGEYNKTFVERCGCPLVGTDVTIGVGGEVHPCSQAPALRPEYVVGNVKSASLDDIMAGEALASFRAGLPHAPCTRCWAPSNVARERLLQVLNESLAR